MPAGSAASQSRNPIVPSVATRMFHVPGSPCWNTKGICPPLRSRRSPRGGTPRRARPAGTRGGSARRARASDRAGRWTLPPSPSPRRARSGARPRLRRTDNRPRRSSGGGTDRRSGPSRRGSRSRIPPRRAPGAPSLGRSIASERGPGAAVSFSSRGFCAGVRATLITSSGWSPVSGNTRKTALFEAYSPGIVRAQRRPSRRMPRPPPRRAAVSGGTADLNDRTELGHVWVRCDPRPDHVRDPLSPGADAASGRGPQRAGHAHGGISAGRGHRRSAR